jgi:hypothetical protein
MKGFLPFTIAIVGIIVTLTSVIGITLIFLVMKYHLVINLKQEYDYNNAQLALLSLVSSKYNDNYSMYRVISERGSNDFENMKMVLEEKLRLVTLSECFRLVNDTATIYEKPGCRAFENTGEIFMFRPYNEGLVERVILVYE